MKKLLAILLSVLMLCTMIPFATVSAAADITVQVYVEDDVTEAVSGDEIVVSINLLNNPGLTSAMVEIEYDPNVLEFVYDEEAEENSIELNGSWAAKYQADAPLENCLVFWQRATATKKQMVTAEWFFSATFIVKDDAPACNTTLSAKVGEKDLFCNVFGADGKAIAGQFTFYTFDIEESTIAINGGASEEPECEHEYNYDCDKNCSKCGEETRPEADHAYFYACDANCMYCYELTNENAAHSENHVAAVEATCQVNGNIEYWYCDVCGASWDVNGMPVNRFTVITFGEHVYTNPCDAHCAVCGELTNEEAAHTIVAVDAVEPTCTENGNVAYWYCSDCGAAWLDAECTMVTNLQSVVLGASCSYNAIYSEGVEPGCHYTGWTENWYCANCDVYYLDAACTIITNYKSLTIPALQDSAEYVPAKAATCDEPGNTEYWVCYECEQIWADAALTQLTNIKNVTIDITHNVIHVEAKAATCDEPGNIEYWYCADCGAAWLDEYCRLNTNLNAVILPISHNVIHVEAKDPTCTTEGNIEYWYCDICGQAWLDELCHLNTNLMAVKLGASCKYGAEYTAANEASCFEPGNTEYWYCANCDVYYADADCTIVTNAKNVIIPISHNIIHVEAVAATCNELGNIEYWYCADCGQAWLDELCHLNTNLMAVKLPTTDEHTYDGEYDVDCNVCGATREVASPINCLGKSVSEDCSGLAFLFNADVIMAEPETNIAVYDDAKIVINGVEYGLKSMGAQVWVDGGAAKKVAAKNLYNWEENAVKFAVRVKDIPESNLDTIIYAQDYYVLDNGVTIYGDIVSGSYNGVLG